MATFGKRSKQKLKTCDQRLQIILNKAIQIYDFSVLEGYRDKDTQNRYYKKGTSKLKYPKSKHNKIPSRAVDIAPWPIKWSDLKRFRELVGIIKGIAHIYGIKITCGADWTKFRDYPHFQLT